MSDAQKIQLETSLDTRPVEQGLNRVVQAAEGASAKMGAAADKAGKAVDKIGDGADGSAQKIDRSTRSIINSIQRVTAQMDAGDKSSSRYFEELARQRGLNVDALRPYLRELDAAKAKQDAAAASVVNMGMSANQTANALRQVPAQFTDIVTSIASGQAPLTVLLQQGGQLKDVFGGVGGAAKALGGYIAGLVNPYTIAAAAVASFGVAAYRGSQEMQELNKALILTGNVAGTTAGRLSDIAASMSMADSSITKSSAAASLQLMVEAGVRGEAQLRRYSTAAAEFERSGGGAAENVASAFESLGKEPLQASLRLNDAMGYLSSSTVETIRSLEAQGRTIDAARVAQDAYASALEQRTPKLVDNLGILERTWKDIAAAAAGAWDNMMRLGRAESLEQRIKSITAEIQSNERMADFGLIGSYINRNTKDLYAQREALKEQARLAARSAEDAGVRSQREKERIAFLGQADKYLTAEQRQQREILSVQNLVTRQIITQEEAEKRIAAIRAASAKKSPKPPRDEFSDVLNRVTMKDAGLDPSFRTDLDTLYAGYQKGRISLDEYREAVEALISAQRFSKDLHKETAQALETEQRFMSLVAQKSIQWAEEDQRRNLSAERMIASIELETSLLGVNASERERVMALRELERIGIEKGSEAYEKYAESVQKALADRQQVQEMVNFWKEVDQTAESVFADIVLNGEDAFARIGEIIRREIVQVLYEMTVKKWIIEIAGSFGGSGVSGGMGSTIMQTALQRYFGGGGGAGAGSAISSYLVASKYGTAYGSQQTAALAAQESGMTTASGGWASYAGYAALIAAAAMIASNLYDKGWNEASAGRGRGQMYGFGNTKFQTDPSYSSSAALDYSAGRFNYDFVKKLGVISDKWNFIASSYQGFAVAFGRKLGAYGYEVDIANGDAETSGFARYKGGLLRSNKTVAIDIDQRDAAVVSQYFESVLEGSKNMARAMGYSTEAIDNYTGSLKVNMKGADSAAEQSERMAKAMDDLEYSLLKAASGGKYTREEFDKMMEGINQSIQAAGISAEGLTDIMVQGLLNNQSGEQIGAALSQMILGGVVQTFAQNAFAPVSQAIMSQIVQPIFVAMASGVPVAQAVSKAAIAGTLETAKKSVEALKAIFNSDWFKELFAEINRMFADMGSSIGSIGIPNIGMPKIPTPKPIDNTKSERERLERELLNLQGNTTELRRRELMDLAPSNRALQERIWALEDERAILDERKTLEQQLLELQGNTTELRRREREELDASNRALYDQVKALEDVKKLQDEWKGLTDTIKEEIDRIRAYAMGQSSASQALSFVQGQYTIATAQARALDQEAAGKLPDLASQLADMYEGAAGSASEYQQMVNSLLSSLEETSRITKDAAGLNDADVQKVQDEELAKKIALLQSSIDALAAQMGENATATKSVSSVLTRVTNNGNAMRTTTA